LPPSTPEVTAIDSLHASVIRQMTDALNDAVPYLIENSNGIGRCLRIEHASSNEDDPAVLPRLHGSAGGLMVIHFDSNPRGRM